MDSMVIKVALPTERARFNSPRFNRVLIFVFPQRRASIASGIVTAVLSIGATFVAFSACANSLVAASCSS